MRTFQSSIKILKSTPALIISRREPHRERHREEGHFHLQRLDQTAAVLHHAEMPGAEIRRDAHGLGAVPGRILAANEAAAERLGPVQAARHLDGEVEPRQAGEQPELPAASPLRERWKAAWEQRDLGRGRVVSGEKRLREGRHPGPGETAAEEQKAGETELDPQEEAAEVGASQVQVEIRGWGDGRAEERYRYTSLTHIAVP